MSVAVCVAANTLYYPDGGGHLWVYLNWALGLRALGCEVIWLESVWPGSPAADTRAAVDGLRDRLRPYGLGDAVALLSVDGEPLSQDARGGCLDTDAAAEADLLLNLAYDIPSAAVRRFRRSALVDIDPGLLQIWLSESAMRLAPHDVYFTIGETVGRPGSGIPSVGLRWLYTPPCVALPWWPPCPPSADAAFTTVSHWYGEEQWVKHGEHSYSNTKRDGFLPFLDLPRLTTQPLELALSLDSNEDADRAALLERGWRIRDSCDVAAAPGDYQRYIGRSLGEFSCVKPSCVRLQNAWISDRTLCYLASGKPAVVQHTGASRFLPDAAGLFRFRDVREAAACLDTVAADYERQCRLARALAEEYFDARKVVASVLERALA